MTFDQERQVRYKETENGIVCGYCGWKIDKPSDSLRCLNR